MRMNRGRIRACRPFGTRTWIATTYPALTCRATYLESNNPDCVLENNNSGSLRFKMMQKARGWRLVLETRNQKLETGLLRLWPSFCPWLLPGPSSLGFFPVVCGAYGPARWSWLCHRYVLTWALLRKIYRMICSLKLSP